MFAVGFVVRPVGGVALGWLAERVGRRPLLALTIARSADARIAEGAVARETDRRLAYEEVGWLRDAGSEPYASRSSTAASGPRSASSSGCSSTWPPPSPPAQALRVHWWFVEDQRLAGDAERGARWLRAGAHVLNGDQLPYAWSAGRRSAAVGEGQQRHDPGGHEPATRAVAGRSGRVRPGTGTM